jgi:hypothetical protein
MLASLRSFASAGTTTTSPASATDDDDDDDERESLRLRSLLGTGELFRRVLLRHRAQFLARLGVVTECLRLEQEGRAEDDDDEDDVHDDGSGVVVRRKRKDVGRSCARFLDALDSSRPASSERNRDNSSGAGVELVAFSLDLKGNAIAVI